MRAKVSIVRCEDYTEGNVKTAVRESLDLIGGISNFVKRGDKVLLKPNLLSFHKPDEAITTHPKVVKAVVQLLQDVGATCIIAESPGGGIPYTADSLKKLYEVTGIASVASETGAILNFNTEWRSVPNNEGKLVKRLDVIKPLLEVDKVINLPKVKTHSFTILTLATKNLFGVVPGFTKVGYHSKLKDIRRFSEMLLDILSFIKPTLTLVDGVIAMEGKGPVSGDLRRLGIILAGNCCISVDLVLCHIIGLEPSRLPIIKYAVERNMSSGKVEDVDVHGLPIEKMRVNDFKLPPTVETLDLRGRFIENFIKPHIKNFFTTKPISNKTCTGCGTCRISCPENAISIVKGRMKIDERKCIRCYCCHEACPEKAVELKQSVPFKIFSWMEAHL